MKGVLIFTKKYRLFHLFHLQKARVLAAGRISKVVIVTL